MKKTYQQLELILAEAERVNTVLVNDYTSLKERVRTLSSEVELHKQKNAELEAADESQKEDIDRLNLIVEYEREQRFDWEQKNERLMLQMNQQRIELLNTQDRLEQQAESLRRITESLKNKDSLVAQHEARALELEESMRGLKANFDDTYKQFTEAKAELEIALKDKDDISGKLEVAKKELEHAKETVTELDTRVNDHQKLMEMEQTHRYNLETQMDELQLHTRKLNQQIADLNAKEKASEKVIEEQKMQILQLERVRDHFTLLLDKEKTSNDADLAKLRGSHDQLIVSSQEKNKEVDTLKAELASLRNKYEQLESEKIDMVTETNSVVQKLSEEVDSLKAQLEADTTAKQDVGNRQKEREKELYTKVKLAEEALQKEREKVRVAEECIVQLRKKHRDELENIQLRSSADLANDHNENGTDDQENRPNGLVEQKLKQSLEEEKQELEKLSQSLNDDRNRYMEDMQKFEAEKASLLEEYQKLEDKTRELDEREADIKSKRDELSELEKQIQEMDHQKEALLITEKTLKELSNTIDAAKSKLQTDQSALDAAKAELESEREKLAQDKLKLEQESKSLQKEAEQIEAEKKTLAEEKSDIDNELSKLVEHKLEIQQAKQDFEDRESQLISIIKEKETKIEELNHSLAEERKQKESLEYKYSAGQKSPDSKGDGLGFSYFKSKKNKDLALEPPPSPSADHLTDEERKQKLFNEYQLLLTEINTTLFQKREQVNETENSGGNYFKKMGLGSLKSSVTKLEDLQARVKKAFRGVDTKQAFTTVDEQAEMAILKAFRNELT